MSPGYTTITPGTIMSGPIKFIHLADLHIGIETHGRLDPATGTNTRLADTLASLDCALDYAVEKKADLVLMAGDIFHRENPHPTEETGFALRLHTLLTRSAAEVVIVLGNHDHPGSAGKSAAVEIFPALDLERVHVMKRPGTLMLDTPGGTVQVACMPWLRPSTILSKEETKGLAPEEVRGEAETRTVAIIRSLLDALDPALPALFVGHLAVRDATLSGSEMTTLHTTDPTIPRTVLARPGLVYSALGHVHGFQDLNPGGPPIVYSGSIERIDFTEEKETKGFVYGEIAPRGGAWECVYELVPTPARRFLTIELDVAGPHGTPEGLKKAIARHDVEGAIVRVRYKLRQEGETLDERALRALLTGAFSIKIERIFETPGKTRRQRELSQKTDPLVALERYIGSKPELEGLSEEMMEYARDILSSTGGPAED